MEGGHEDKVSPPWLLGDGTRVASGGKMGAWSSGMRRAASRCRRWRTSMGANVSTPWRSRPTARASRRGATMGAWSSGMRRAASRCRRWGAAMRAICRLRGVLGDGTRRVEGDDGRVVVWDASSGEQVQAMEGGHGGNMSDPWRSRRRHARRVGGLRGRVVVWDASSGEQVQAMEGGHGGEYVNSVAFSATARASRRGRRWARGRLGCVERRAGAGDGRRPWGRMSVRGVLGDGTRVASGAPVGAWSSGTRRAASRCRRWRTSMGANVSTPWRSRRRHASRRGARWARGRLGCVERRAGAGDGGRP